MEIFLSIGFLSILIAIFSRYFLQKKTFGFLDPLNMYFYMRVSPMLAFAALASGSDFINSNYILFVISGLFLILGLFFTTPSINYNTFGFYEFQIKYVYRVTIALILIKLLILIVNYESLPIFSHGGSDAYIDFDLNNKLSSTFLLALGSVDLALISFLIPLRKTRTSKFLIIILLLFLVLISMSGGKKSSMLQAILSISLGEYLRVAYLSNQRYFFLSLKGLFIGVLLAIMWAFWVYARTIGYSFKEMNDIQEFDITRIFQILDFVMHQWSYPFELFVYGDLDQFLEGYQVNQAHYFLHSLLSPLGFPAFALSIGPAIDEFMTGRVGGGGINPTFLIEGYVLFGNFVPVYSFLVGCLMGVIRKRILQIKSLEYRIIVSAFMLPILYSLAIDALLFFKVLFVFIFIFIVILKPLRLLSYGN